jgi:hypothetical protein
MPGTHNHNLQMLKDFVSGGIDFIKLSVNSSQLITMLKQSKRAEMDLAGFHQTVIIDHN